MILVIRFQHSLSAVKVNHFCKLLFSTMTHLGGKWLASRIEFLCMWYPFEAGATVFVFKRFIHDLSILSH